MQKFNIGDKVWYDGSEWLGTIMSCINADDPKDVSLQGYRYIVSRRLDTYTVPESFLRIEEVVSRDQNNGQQAPALDELEQIRINANLANKG